MTDRSTVLLDGSRLLVEASVRAGADVYVGYPITPANWIYSYASSRFPSWLQAPDEITAMQWMAGLSAAGRLPVSATAFPGLALMVESLNMAFMMELPMVLVVAQRLGPSTGTATAGAQGELFFLHGAISGGAPLPTLCIGDLSDCWELPPVALKTAVDLRCPVVLLTSKEMVMTERSFDLGRLAAIEPVRRSSYEGEAPYVPYAAGDGLAPPFLAVGSDRHQVRLTASTHDETGLLQHSSPGALANTRRLQDKVERGVPVLFELDEDEGASVLVMTYGVTAGAAREATSSLRRRGHAVSLLVARTLLPLPDAYAEIAGRYGRVVVAEENLQGQLARLLFGSRLPASVTVACGIGRMVSPDRIAEAVAA